MRGGALLGGGGSVVIKGGRGGVPSGATRVCYTPGTANYNKAYSDDESHPKIKEWTKSWCGHWSFLVSDVIPSRK